MYNTSKAVRFHWPHMHSVGKLVPPDPGITMYKFPPWPLIATFTVCELSLSRRPFQLMVFGVAGVAGTQLSVPVRQVARDFVHVDVTVPLRAMVAALVVVLIVRRRRVICLDVRVCVFVIGSGYSFAITSTFVFQCSSFKSCLVRL
jgi:hypothetical protein